MTTPDNEFVTAARGVKAARIVAVLDRYWPEFAASLAADPDPMQIIRAIQAGARIGIEKAAGCDKAASDGNGGSASFATWSLVCAALKVRASAPADIFAGMAQYGYSA